MPRPATEPPAVPTDHQPQGGGRSVYWILSAGATLLLVMGWLLPWLVQASAGGVGFSPQDVVTTGPNGIAAALTYAMGLAMIVVVLLMAAEMGDAAAGRRALALRGPQEVRPGAGGGRRLALASAATTALLAPAIPLARLHRFTVSHLGERRLQLLRTAAAVAGLLMAVIIWLLAKVLVEEPVFGPVNSHTLTDSAVWITWIGFAVAALLSGMRRLFVSRPNAGLALVSLPLAALVPLLFHQSPDIVVWAAGSLAIYTLLALGLNVVVGFAGLLDLGYAAFFAIGAYTSASLASPKYGIHLPLWVLIFVGAAVAALFGAILGAPTLRLRGDYLAIVTLGFGEIIPDLATNDVGRLTGGPNGISGIDQPSYGPISFSLSHPQWYYWSLLVLVLGVIVLLRNLERSRVGRAWMALREDEVASAATGINTTTTKLLAFAIGASVSGFAGAFYGSLVTIVSPQDFSFSVSVSVLSIIVLGGIGNITGVILGSFVLTFVIFWALPHLNEWTGTVGQTLGTPALSGIDFTRYTYVVYGLALILMMLLRPGGLLPSSTRRVELESTGEESLAAVQGRA